MQVLKKLGQEKPLYYFVHFFSVKLTKQYSKYRIQQGEKKSVELEMEQNYKYMTLFNINIL